MDVCCTDSSEKGENQPLIAKMNRYICTNNGKSFELTNEELQLAELLG